MGQPRNRFVEWRSVADDSVSQKRQRQGDSTRDAMSGKTLKHWKSGLSGDDQVNIF